MKKITTKKIIACILACVLVSGLFGTIAYDIGFIAASILVFGVSAFALAILWIVTTLID